MRSGKQLIDDSKKFSCECRWRSWLELLSTIIPTILLFALGFIETVPLPVRIFSSVICGLLYVRLFVIYHDYQHRAILQNSEVAKWFMTFLGIYLLAPGTIWRRSHEHHHNHNSKLTLSGIGSYPTVCKVRYLKLSAREKMLYLINRHPLTVFFGYLTVFIYWLNIKSYIESPKRHFDSLIALVLHLSVTSVVVYFYGPVVLVFGWCFPFFLAFSMGAYLFYSQHNFPEAKFRENHDWTYDHAAINSTSRMMMSPVMHWFTGNIGYHHIHHLNSRIPFYRLKEAMDSMPELNHVPTTSWHPSEMLKCLRLKVWDAENDKMITLKQLRLQTS
jgi:omega-6 fatty acid desaturase (delta-12 desaturase)